MQKIKFMQASKQPLQDLEKVTYAGQPESRRQFRAGYGIHLEQLPKFDGGNDEVKLGIANNAMKDLGQRLLGEDWIKEDMPEAFDFSRTILAIEKQRVDNKGQLREGTEIIVAKWGVGFSSPIHGHKEGFIYEELLSGKLKVNLYRIVDFENSIVRPIRSDIFKGNEQLVSMYGKAAKEAKTSRSALVHSFTAIEPSVSLHYVPEHTRDGRDNRFRVEYFPEPAVGQLTRITSQDGMYLRKGDVCLVRSTNVPEYGDHYIVVTGHPVVKEHGLRVQDIAIAAPNTKDLLDSYEMKQGLILLKLSTGATKDFHEFHGVQTIDNEIIFPKPIQ